jgi:hypothetical protein
METSRLLRLFDATADARCPFASSFLGDKCHLRRSGLQVGRRLEADALLQRHSSLHDVVRAETTGLQHTGETCRSVHRDRRRGTGRLTTRTARAPASSETPAEEASSSGPGSDLHTSAIDTVPNVASNGYGSHAPSNGSPGRPAHQNVSEAAALIICAPEDFVLGNGELSTIDKHSACSPADVFRCSGCTEAACQVQSRP